MKITDIKLERLIDYLTPFDWQRDCEIVPAYMPPYPSPDTRPRCVIRWCGSDGRDTFLRYSHGPMQGHFWDIYGDDYQNIELAILAIYQAPPPSRVGVVIANHGRPSPTQPSETMQPDTYTGGNFNGVTEGEK